MVMNPTGHGPENDCAGEGGQRRKRQTGPFVRDGESHQQTRNCLTVIKIWSWAPDGCLTQRQTGRLTVGRNITLPLNLTLTLTSGGGGGGGGSPWLCSVRRLH
jgi:hypothetical protein